MKVIAATRLLFTTAARLLFTTATRLLFTTATRFLSYVAPNGPSLRGHLRSRIWPQKIYSADNEIGISGTICVLDIATDLGLDLL